jgi:Putative zinc-finger
MKCDVCQANIEDYFDGELGSKLDHSVAAHLAGCADCSKLFEELKQEQQLYARYQRDVEVTPALWAAVEARIKQEKLARPTRQMTTFRDRLVGMVSGIFATPRLSPAFTAALVLLAIGITVTVMSLLHSPRNDGAVALNNSNSSGEVAVTGNDANSNAQTTTGGDSSVAKREDGKNESDKQAPDSNKQAPDNKQTPENKSHNNPALQRQLVANAKPAPQLKVTPEQLVREAEQKYVAAIAILSRDVNRRRSQIDPMVLARFDSALADIDRTIVETKRIVRGHPDDPIALQYLLGAYSKKVDVLRDMAAEGQ